MRVAAINGMRGKANTPTACEIYRTNMPFVFMHQKGGHETAYFYMDQLVDWYRTKGAAAIRELAAVTDILVFPRLVSWNSGYLEAVASLISAFRYLGVKMIYEVDDDLTNEYRRFDFADAMKIASWCDAITVSTDYLGDRMRKATGRPTFTLPNMIDPEVWDNPDDAQPRVELIVGLSGSPTHYQDWIVLKDVIPEILSRTYDRPVQFWLTAFHPDYFSNLPEVDHGQGMVRIPSLIYTHYAEMVRACDIILAPVDPNDGFNLSKSPIKIVEGMGASRPVNGQVGGAACIATNCVVYNKTANGSNALLVPHTPEAWLHEIDALLRNAPKRSDLQVRAHRWVWRHHNIRQSWRLWEQVYKKVLKLPPHQVYPFKELVP